MGDIDVETNRDASLRNYEVELGSLFKSNKEFSEIAGFCLEHGLDTIADRLDEAIAWLGR